MKALFFTFCSLMDLSLNAQSKSYCADLEGVWQYKLPIWNNIHNGNYRMEGFLFKSSFLINIV